MRKSKLLLICVTVLFLGAFLAGCASMRLEYLEEDTVSGPSHVRQYQDINPREITIWGIYKDGSRKVVDVVQSQITFDSSRPGPQTVSVRVGTLTRQEVRFQTEVVPLSGMAITSQPRQTLFKVGEDPNPAWPGLEVRGTWGQLGDENIPLNMCEITGYRKDQAGNQTITVAFKGQIANFNVDVRSMSGLEIIDLPIKRDYYQGENLDLSGLRVRGLWGDGIPDEELPVSRNDVTGFNGNNRGIQHLTITKNERTTSFDVEVWGLARLEIHTVPVKTSYIDGEQFDPTGILVKGIYTGSTDATREGEGFIPIDRLRFDGYTPGNWGAQIRITVWVEGYNEVFNNFFITVRPAPDAQ